MKKQRCPWCGEDPQYREYHDQEWGWPVGDDRQLFEKLCLEGFQAGLSWLTILRKRTAFREVFHDFEIERVAGLSDAEIEVMLGDARIVRHRKKLESARKNARLALDLQQEYSSLAAFFWSFEDREHRAPRKPEELHDRVTSRPATACAKALKLRGFSFVGPTTLYAFQQSIGIVNDHLQSCWVYGAVEEARAAFSRPG